VSGPAVHGGRAAEVDFRREHRGDDSADMAVAAVASAERAKAEVRGEE
jgi:hypothetical protein